MRYLKDSSNYMSAPTLKEHDRNRGSTEDMGIDDVKRDTNWRTAWFHYQKIDQKACMVRKYDGIHTCSCWIDIPATYGEVTVSGKAKNWKGAMDEEMNSLRT